MPSKNWVDAISSASEISEPGIKPTDSIALTTNSHAASTEANEIPRPPSSAIRWVTLPSAAPNFAAASRTATIQESASENVIAPVGTINTS